MKHVHMTVLLRIIRVGAVVFAVAFMGIGVFFALGEPRGFSGGMQNVLAGSQDLFMRHNEVSMILLGENPYQLARAGMLKERGAEVLGPGHHMDPDYFPSTLLPVLLMAKLPFETIKLLWLLINLGSLLLLVHTLRWCMGGDRPAPANQTLMICLWICGIPVWSCLAMGQASIFSVAFTLAAFRLDFNGRHWLAGLLLSLGVFKYALIWPLVLFLFVLQRRWRCLLIGGGIHLVVHLWLCDLIDANPVAIFAEVLSCNAKVFNFNSMLTFWMPFRMWNQFFLEFPVPAQLLGSLFFLIVLGWLGRLWLRRDKNDRDNLLAWMAALLLLAVLTVNSRIFAHLHVLPVLLLACAPALSAYTWSQRARLMACVLYLSYLPSGMEDMDLQDEVLLLLRTFYNTVLLLLAVDLGRLLGKTEHARYQAHKTDALPA
ncbi:glycosyltransferase family 87 protein [Prosthecobacter sp.]|uniref:glycosyltransferase family 87 protein n=1 Tax=Prosthecobacter sp. TaxID=1965333 RepID=UPI002ABBED36|nr:glycosyltransferase family 87 protein [Prosthecobacter sp.]MDZ4405099.1 glycosyltransferase family 87 protein [Prosthecobacter sp.]